MIKKAGTIYGLILGLISVFGVFIFEGGTVKALFLLAPIIIVFGGTFAATIIGFGFEKFKDIWKLTKIAYFPPVGRNALAARPNSRPPMMLSVPR